MTVKEIISSKEEYLIQEMETILKEKMLKDYEVGKIKRDAHPKHLGLLKGQFIIEPNLPENLKTSIFQNSKTYNCWIRVSNSSGKIQSDKIKDFRGFAIKLLDVEGDFLSEDEKYTQDFLLMSHPTMPLGTVKLFRDAVYYSIKWHPMILALKFLISGKGAILKVLKNEKKLDTSPLDISYWSTTPYQFKDAAVKYKIVPASSYKSKLPTELTDNYLTENMARHLKEEEASFDFMIQFFKDEKSTPIENAGVEWIESISPFIKVASIVIPKQIFTTEKRNELAESISLSPFHALTEHKPLGGINRARAIIYKSLFNFRNKLNNKDSKIIIGEEYNSIK